MLAETIAYRNVYIICGYTDGSRNNRTGRFGPRYLMAAAGRIYVHISMSD